MMKSNKIVPIKAEVNLKYECPQCQTEYWHTLQEAKTEGFKIVCWCGKVSALQTIVDCKIDLTTKKIGVKRKNGKPVCTTNHAKKIAQKALTKMGFKVKSIQGAIDRVKSDNAEEIIREALQQLKE